jgi:hypothetical protein
MTYNLKLMRHIQEEVLRGRRPEFIQKTADKLYEHFYERGKKEYAKMIGQNIFILDASPYGWAWNEGKEESAVFDKLLSFDMGSFTLVSGDVYENFGLLHPITAMPLSEEGMKNNVKGGFLCTRPVMFYLAHEYPHFLGD